MNRSRAKQILGISGDVDKTLLKRKYRVKVKQLHPDKNKSKTAQQDFLELQEAYEYLLNPPKIKLAEIKVPSEKEVRKARAYHQKQKRKRKTDKEQKIAIESYSRFLQSNLFKLHKVFVALGVLLAVIHVADNVAEPIQRHVELSSFEFNKAIKRNSGLLLSQVEYNYQTFYAYPLSDVNYNPVVTESYIFKDLLEVKFDKYYSKKIYLASRSMLFPLICGLLFPLIGLFRKGPNIFFYLSVRWGQIAIPLLYVFTLFEQFRIIRLI